MRPRRIPQLPAIILALCCAGAPAATAAPGSSRAATASPAVQSALNAALRGEARGPIRNFYEERGYRPLWITNGKVGPQAETLISYLGTANVDGLKPRTYRVPKLRAAIAQAQFGDARALARVEFMLSEAFTRYVRDQRTIRGQRRSAKDAITFVDPSLRPIVPAPEMVLRAAAMPASFSDYLKAMGWMSPQYVKLRELAVKAAARGLSAAATERLQRNMHRARQLPNAWSRHVVVDSSSGRLWYYENGKQVGVMRVVVGTAKTPTPLLAGYLQWAIFNPYWNVPDNLVRTNIAPKILSGRTLQSMRIEALSDWSAAAQKIPASRVNWPAVAAGTQEVRLRELPGPSNSMGAVKLLFPNDEGIYLHDTPSRDLLKADNRHFSNGCIRLEKAHELTRWLLGNQYRKPGRAPEQQVALPMQVPVYITYLTAAATDAGLAFRDDVYGLDD